MNALHFRITVVKRSEFAKRVSESPKSQKQFFLFWIRNLAGPGRHFAPFGVFNPGWSNEVKDKHGRSHDINDLMLN